MMKLKSDKELLDFLEDYVVQLVLLQKDGTTYYAILNHGLKQRFQLSTIMQQKDNKELKLKALAKLTKKEKELLKMGW